MTRLVKEKHVEVTVEEFIYERDANTGEVTHHVIVNVGGIAEKGQERRKRKHERSKDFH